MYQDEESVCAELAARSLTNKGRLFPDFYLRQNQSRRAAAPLQSAEAASTFT